MVDFTRTLMTATRLIKANGRPISLRRPEEQYGDIDLTGAFLSPTSQSIEGLAVLGTGTQIDLLINRSQQVIIAHAPQPSAMPAGASLLGYNSVWDPQGPLPDAPWGVAGMQILQPATLAILLFIGVRR